MAADPVPLSNRLQKKGGRTPKRFEPEHPAKNPTMKKQPAVSRHLTSRGTASVSTTALGCGL